MTTTIDTTLNFWSDTPEGKDPDAVSPTLREYHRILWSKPLPNNVAFTLDAKTPDAYLHHRSDLGEFFLSSDTANSSYKQVRALAHLRNQIPADEVSTFRTLIYSIGNMIIFPGRQAAGNMTPNQARGCNRMIGDRFDLTLECIRRHYLQNDSPLAETLKAYAVFFDLFGSFRGYVDFFLLQDLVAEDYSEIGFYLPFHDFPDQSPYPDSIDAFRTYFSEASKFIHARNRRISEYAGDKV